MAGGLISGAGDDIDMALKTVFFRIGLGLLLLTSTLSAEPELKGEPASLPPSVADRVRNMEAKAAFDSAEERFKVNDYAGCLRYLDQATETLGKPNGRILLLRIQTEAELAKSDLLRVTNVLDTISKFEAAPDFEKFDDERIMEVMRLKVRLKNQLKGGGVTDVAIGEKEGSASLQLGVAAFLGIQFLDVTPTVVADQGLSVKEGALVASFAPDSPAEQAGIRIGDVVTKLNDAPIAAGQTLKSLISELAPGAKVNLSINRKGAAHIYRVTLGAVPPPIKSSDSTASGEAEALHGVVVEDITPDSRRQYAISPALRGAIVTEVPVETYAHAAGLRVGDLIQELDGAAVPTAEAAVKVASNAAGKHVSVKVFRNGATRVIAVPSGQK